MKNIIHEMPRFNSTAEMLRFFAFQVTAIVTGFYLLDPLDPNKTTTKTVIAAAGMFACHGVACLAQGAYEFIFNFSIPIP